MVVCYNLYLSSVVGVKLQGFISLSVGPSRLQHYGQLLIVTRQLYRGHTDQKWAHHKDITWVMCGSLHSCMNGYYNKCFLGLSMWYCKKHVSERRCWPGELKCRYCVPHFGGKQHRVPPLPRYPPPRLCLQPLPRPADRPSLLPPPEHTNTPLWYWTTLEIARFYLRCKEQLGKGKDAHQQILTSSLGLILYRILSAFSLSWRLSMMASSSLDALFWEWKQGEKAGRGKENSKIRTCQFLYPKKTFALHASTKAS